MHAAIVSVHPLYDTRIENHIRSLLEWGHTVTYVNWSDLSDSWRLAGEPGVELIHRRAPQFFRSRPAQYLRMLGWFTANLVRLAPDLVHIHDPQLLPTVFPLRLASRARLVFDAHEHYLRTSGPVGRFLKLLYRTALPCVHGLVATSPSVGRELPAPSTVVPNHQRRAEFSKCAEPTAKDGPCRRLVYFGSLASSDRDVELLLDVATTVLREDERARFELGGPSGDERLRRRFDELARDQGARFRYHGVMPRETVVRATAGADIGFLLIRSGAENILGASPNKIFEYTAAGVAIVATDGFQVADEVRRSGAGLLFPPGVPPATLSGQVLELLRDGRRLDEMKRNSARLGEQYSWEAAAEGYRRLYSTLGLA
ncbi:MAG: glycosyltransferase family 4 protein [Candidatus Riflebacteria bacterium]|nr:glycosyltransferase family 4 protein [Candidatus Riflebacteria bacterium]